MKNKVWLFALGLIVGIVIVVAVLSWSQPLSNMSQSARITLGTTTITADIVATEATREQGLSGKEGLATSTGLFFIFESENYWGIWMKDMKFAIDVLWFDRSGTVVGLTEDMKPESYPKVFIPQEKAFYVLEIPVGTIKTSKIKIGEQAKISFPTP